MTDTISVQRLAALERQFAELKAESTDLRNRAETSAAQLAQHQKEFEEQKNHNEELTQQIHEMQEVEARNDELDFELQRIEGERDFHRRHHIEAKKTEHHRQVTDFSLGSLRKELAFRREESDSLKRWLAELNAQLEDLSSFIRPPVADPKHDAETEQLYTQKVVELESSLRKLKEKNANLTSNAANRRPTVDSNLSAVRLDQSKVLVSENEALRVKVESLKKENQLIRHELEKTRAAKQAQGGAPSPAPVGKFSAQDQAVLDKYAAEIEQLKKENAKLVEESGPVVREFSDQNAPDLASRLQAANTEKALLEEEIQQLMETIGYKDKEIESLRLEGGNGDVTRRLVEANKKMVIEIGRMQEQIRRFESFSRDSIMNSFNN